ncbi:MAG: hypothetical protein QJR03_06815 [Sphaerobacter sp.]|nr:hypothetical protein [Sphaerobacter sp.]
MRRGAPSGTGRIAGALLILLCVVVLAACGGAGPATATATSAVATAPASPIAASPAPAAATPATALREADWGAVLRADPHLRTEPASPGMPGALGDLYLAEGPGGVSGFPALRDIQFGDLDGDGQEEAIIPLQSDGTSGTIGVLVYRAGPDGPRLAATRAGARLSLRLDGGQLVLREAAYAGWEPNCCPSAWVETRYRLAGDALEPTAERVEPVQGTERLTAEHFYALLADGRYEEAYTFLSPGFQAAHPYDAWRAAYAGTERITAYVAQSEPGRVTVNLETEERAADGAVVIRHFSGTWDLVFSAERKQWLLDRAELKEVP